MSNNAVTIVVDPNVEENSPEVWFTGPVWIVDTPANGAIVQKLRGARSDITTFTVDDHTLRAANLFEILEAVELHHGEISQPCGYSSLRIIGLSGTSDIVAKLAMLGFINARNFSAGFTADRIRGTTFLDQN